MDMSNNLIKPEIQGVSVVVIGSFNPAIFQPRWLSSNNLIRDEEAEVAEQKLKIVHPDVTMFATDWFSLQVTTERFGIDSDDPTKSRSLKDLVSNIFKILEHTPLTSLGFNASRHFSLESIEEWHEFGHHFTPKKSWHAILDNPGMLSLTIEGQRENCDADRIRVKMEPSVKTHPGVYIQVNQHYSLLAKEDVTKKSGISKFHDILQGSWDEFLAYCDSVVDHLFNEYKKED